jgi:hypothetical protein
MSRWVTGARTLLIGLIANGVALGVASPSVAAGSPSSTRPAWLLKTVLARPYLASAPSFVPNVEAAGTPVPKSDVTRTRTSASADLKFGLATFPASSQTYPVISTDGGRTWKVDGPLFHVDALQGASVITALGRLGSHGAYFWGRGANVVWVTTDEGAHWWSSGFPDYGVHSVSARRGVLRAISLGQQFKNDKFEGYLYVSANSGQTWTLRGRSGIFRA